MNGNEKFAIELKQRQYDFLTQIAAKYGLPDASKAARCLINYAIEKADNESSIFSDTRCMDC